MKKILLIVLSLASFVSFGQRESKREAHHEKIDAMRVAYITKEADLTAEEAQVFWPLYNELTDKIRTLEKEDRKAHSEEMKAENRSEKEVEEGIQAHFKREAQKLEIQKEYHEKLKKVLSVSKIEKVYIAEFKFKRKLMREYKNRDHKRERPHID